MSLAWEKFSAAVQSLTGSGHQRDRLCEAYLRYLASLHVKDMPAEVRSDFEMLTDSLLGYSRDVDKIRHAIASADEVQIKAIIALILRMHAVLVQYQPFPIGIDSGGNRH